MAFQDQLDEPDHQESALNTEKVHILPISATQQLMIMGVKDGKDQIQTHQTILICLRDNLKSSSKVFHNCLFQIKFFPIFINSRVSTQLLSPIDDYKYFYAISSIK